MSSMNEDTLGPGGQKPDDDVHHAVKTSRRFQIDFKSFFAKLGGSIKRHPWWTAIVVVGSIGFCPICKYFATMIMAGGIICAVRGEVTHTDT